MNANTDSVELNSFTSGLVRLKPHFVQQGRVQRSNAKTQLSLRERLYEVAQFSIDIVTFRKGLADFGAQDLAKAAA